MTETILVLNVGSSSIKFAVYPADEDAGPVLAGTIDGIGRSPKLRMKGARPAESLGPFTTEENHTALIQRLVAWLEEALDGRGLIAAGHRIVHGGRDFAEPVAIDEEVLRKLEALVPLARRGVLRVVGPEA